ncbi:ferredoxin [Myxococcota bacterium]|nr:ferredoxin [Myxococcota bacterium]
MKVRVDQKLCVGHGRCYELAPEVYDEDERGHCRLVASSVAPELVASAQRGAVNCPEHAIRVEEEVDP